jgi:hypothetical protein
VQGSQEGSHLSLSLLSSLDFAADRDKVDELFLLNFLVIAQCRIWGVESERERDRKRDG